MRFVGIALCVLLFHVAAGCSDPFLPAPQAAILVGDQIKIGSSRSEVITLLGEPSKQETLGKTEFLFYRMGWQFGVYDASRNPVAIADGKVVGFGTAYYENAAKAQKVVAAAG